MKKYLIIGSSVLFSFLVVFGFVIFIKSASLRMVPREMASSLSMQMASVAAIVNSPFHYRFSVAGTLYESGNMKDSSSPYWWLNSGGIFYLKDDIGFTIKGELPAYSKWRLAYAASNPVDTDNGYHPQNILRLVTRSKWKNFREEVYFKIIKDNLSSSTNRNASNGILLFNRYQDGNSLYYTGIRVDGAAVIKKKINGEYHTMAYKRIFSGTYNRDTNPNLLPENIWIGLKSEVKNNADGTVSIKLYMDQGKTGVWKLVAEAIDDGKSFGGAAITNEGYGGIRTDFMDVEFDDYKITSL